MQEKIELHIIQLTPSAFEEALEKASRRGAMLAMQLCGVPVKEMLSLSELYTRFGRGKINRMKAEGKLKAYRADESARPKYKLSEVTNLFN